MAKPARINLNSNTSSASITDIVRDSMGITGPSDDKPRYTIAFKASAGKGTGEQHIVPEDVADFMAAVEDVIENGIPNEEDTFTAAEMFRRTVKMRTNVVDSDGNNTGDWVTFRLGEGQGAKPVKMRLHQLPEFLTVMTEGMDNAMRWFLKNPNVEGYDAAAYWYASNGKSSVTLRNLCHKRFAADTDEERSEIDGRIVAAAK